MVLEPGWSLRAVQTWPHQGHPAPPHPEIEPTETPKGSDKQDETATVLRHCLHIGLQRLRPKVYTGQTAYTLQTHVKEHRASTPRRMSQCLLHFTILTTRLNWFSTWVPSSAGPLTHLGKEYHAGQLWLWWVTILAISYAWETPCPNISAKPIPGLGRTKRRWLGCHQHSTGHAGRVVTTMPVFVRLTSSHQSISYVVETAMEACCGRVIFDDPKVQNYRHLCKDHQRLWEVSTCVAILKRTSYRRDLHEKLWWSRILMGFKRTSWEVWHDCPRGRATFFSRPPGCQFRPLPSTVSAACLFCDKSAASPSRSKLQSLPTHPALFSFSCGSWSLSGELLCSSHCGTQCQRHFAKHGEGIQLFFWKDSHKVIFIVEL